MKRIFFCLCCVVVLSLRSQAASIFSEDFNSYSNGNLTNQGPWLQTGASVSNLIQVSSGRVTMQNTGQDVYAPFGAPYTIADGTSFYIGLSLNVSAAAATGDYFLHVTPTVGNSSAFFERLFVKSSGAGYLLGYLETSGSGGAVNYGSTVLDFNTDYRTVVAYNAVAGALNDTASVYVNPTDLTVEANNTAYISLDTWTTVSSETNTVAAVNFRQGTAGSAATLSLDNLSIGSAFVDVSSVPEPQSLFLVGGLGLLACNFWRRRK